jgi:hypothetical protein
MAELTRQLAVIMFTDIAGYTTLMGEDEQMALNLLKIEQQEASRKPGQFCFQHVMKAITSSLRSVMMARESTQKSSVLWQ